MNAITTNPRITNYCLANGLTLAQTAGQLWKYVLWNREMWAQWRAERGIEDRWHQANYAEMADYDEWLARKSISLANLSSGDAASSNTSNAIEISDLNDSPSPGM